MSCCGKSRSSKPRSKREIMIGYIPDKITNPIEYQKFCNECRKHKKHKQINKILLVISLISIPFIVATLYVILINMLYLL